MTIVGLVLLCLLGLYMFIGGFIVWAYVSCVEDTTPLTCLRYVDDLEDIHTILWSWAPHFKDGIVDWWADVSEWMKKTLNTAGIIVVSIFLALAFIAFLLEWAAAMILQIPLVLIWLMVELFARLGRLLLCKR